MGPRICIFNKVPNDADDAGLGTTLWDLLLYTMRHPPTSKTSLLTMSPHTMWLQPGCQQWPWEWRSEKGGKCIHLFLLLHSLVCFSIPFLFNLFLTKTDVISITCKMFFKFYRRYYDKYRLSQEEEQHKCILICMSSPAFLLCESEFAQLPVSEISTLFYASYSLSHLLHPPG